VAEGAAAVDPAVVDQETEKGMDVGAASALPNKNILPITASSLSSSRIKVVFSWQPPI